MRHQHEPSAAGAVQVAMQRGSGGRRKRHELFGVGDTLTVGSRQGRDNERDRRHEKEHGTHHHRGNREADQHLRLVGRTWLHGWLDVPLGGTAFFSAARSALRMLRIA
jgi:hypothetical protein